MTESDKIIMTLNIGGERFDVNVPFSSQKEVREAEKAANLMAENIRQKFPASSNAGVLARVAYRFASKYQELFNEETEALNLMENASNRLEELLKPN